MCWCVDVTSSSGRAKLIRHLFLPLECAAISEIKAREPVRCRECGHRIMYKKRTNRMVGGDSACDRSIDGAVC